MDNSWTSVHQTSKMYVMCSLVSARFYIVITSELLRLYFPNTYSRKDAVPLSKSIKIEFYFDESIMQGMTVLG